MRRLDPLSMDPLSMDPLSMPPAWQPCAPALSIARRGVGPFLFHLARPKMSANQRRWNREKHQCDRIPQGLVTRILKPGDDAHGDRQRSQAKRMFHFRTARQHRRYVSSDADEEETCD